MLMDLNSVDYSDEVQTSIVNQLDKEKAKLTRAELVEMTMYTDQGDRMSFEGRNYALPIYNYPWHKMLLVASRQSEKSTFMKNDIITDSVMIDNYDTLFVTASSAQAKDFSVKKLSKSFIFNDSLKKMYVGDKRSSEVKNDVFYKSFRNGSEVTLRFAGDNAERCRGLTARKIVLDELQSIAQEGIPVIMECGAHYERTGQFKLLEGGTPLSHQNFLNKEWNKSKGFEFLLKCPHTGCKMWNDPIGLQHIHVKREFVFCQHCGKEIENPMDPSIGHWVATRPDASFPGFRLPRLIIKGCTWRSPTDMGVLDLYEKYPEDRFMNEVMALSHSNSFQPTSEETLKLHSTGLDSFLDPRVDQPTDKLRVAGLDWAMQMSSGESSRTVFWVMEWNPSTHKLEMVFGYKFTRETAGDILDAITMFVQNFRVHRLICDHGAGHTMNQLLAQRLPDRVFENQYVNMNTSNIKWKQEDSVYQCNRHLQFEDLFMFIDKGMIKFPQWGVWQNFAEDFLNIYYEYDIGLKRRKYAHEKLGADDSAHAMQYCLISLQTCLGKSLKELVPRSRWDETSPLNHL